MYSRFGDNPYSRQGPPRPTGLGALCCFAGIGLLFYGLSATGHRRSWQFLLCLCVAVLGALFNAAISAFTTTGMNNVMRRPLRFNSSWLRLMLLADMGLFYGFHRLGTFRSSGWWWIGISFILLFAGTSLTVLTSSANADNQLEYFR